MFFPYPIITTDQISWIGPDQGTVRSNFNQLFNTWFQFWCFNCDSLFTFSIFYRLIYCSFPLIIIIHTYLINLRILLLFLLQSNNLMCLNSCHTKFIKSVILNWHHLDILNRQQTKIHCHKEFLSLQLKL